MVMVGPSGRGFMPPNAKQVLGLASSRRISFEHLPGVRPCVRSWGHSVEPEPAQLKGKLLLWQVLWRREVGDWSPSGGAPGEGAAVLKPIGVDGLMGGKSILPGATGQSFPPMGGTTGGVSGKMGCKGR